MTLRNIPLFIDGQFQQSSTSKQFMNIHPASGQEIATIQHGSMDDVDAAVEAARQASKGPWAKMSMADRSNLLRKIADEIDRRHDDFLKAEIEDTGKPISFASKVDIPRGAANFRAFADLMYNFPNEVFPQDTEDGLGAIHYTIRKPLGVIAVICPWNLPLLLMTWKVAPALATGNTVVVKASEETPSTAALLGEVMQSVGLPKGVYNVVHGFGADDVGQALVRHKDVDAITFTGESSTGQAIMRDAATQMKAVSFELGGKNPSIVFADADFDKALAGTIKSTFSNCGQVCLCSERVYVQRPIYDRFVQEMAKAAQQIKIGDPWDRNTDMGPLISKVHQDKVLSYFDIAKKEGAQVITGAQKATVAEQFEHGYFVEPTIVTGLSDQSRIQREEIFGPICHISPFDDENEAIRRANDTEYGLCSAIWTENLSRAHRVSRQMETGITWVNSWYLRDLRTPFGGNKMSGLGREGGKYSLEFYTELQSICIKI